jgi:hypothetical protein
VELEKQLEALANSLKGIQGTGRLLGAMSNLIGKVGANATLEPGDFVRTKRSPIHISAPLAYDLWYLFNDVNLVHHIDPHADSEQFVSERLKFLKEKLNSLKPMKAVTNADLINDIIAQPAVFEYKDDWSNQGAYFIQVMVYEMCQKETDFAFDSSGPPGISDTSTSVGHLTFPVGQLGVMEVVSMFQETELEVDDFSLAEDETPVQIGSPDMFPPMDHAGENRSFGKYLIESSYLIPENMKDRVEIMADCVITEDDYTKDVKPKSWTRLWIKKEDVFPVPGEFIGILIKPLSCPPHVWWFQESTPLLYSGNWVETQNLTSGIITMVTLEEDRMDGGIGEEYWVKINGIEIIAYASDFKRYEVDDRVAVLKRWTVDKKADRSFTWKDQRDGIHPIKNQVSLEFVILPITFYKEQ